MVKKLFFLTVLFVSVVAASVTADVIYLENGEAIAGKVVRETEVFIRIEALDGEDGKIKEFLWEEVADVEYGTMTIDQPEVVEAPAPEPEEEPAKIAPKVRRITITSESQEPESVLPPPQEAGEETVSADDDILTQEEAAIIERRAQQQEVQSAADGPEDDMANEPAVVESQPESTKLDDAAIAEILGEEGEEARLSEEEMLAMQEQAMEQLRPNAFKMTLLAIMALLITFAVPAGICAVIGFFIARKFDSEEAEEEEVTRFDETGKPIGPGSEPVASGPAEKEPPAATKQPAGFFRRAAARLIDGFLGAGLATALSFLPGLFIPIDKAMPVLMGVVMLPLIVLFTAYYFWGIAKLNNTYGRYCVNIRVVDEESRKKPSLKQAFKRDLLFFLWPLDVFVVAFSRCKKRIGDKWANTRSYVTAYKSPWLKRLAPGLILGFLIYSFSSFATPIINDNTEIAGVAKEYLIRRHGEELVGKPSEVQIVNQDGWVSFKFKNGECHGASLIYTEGDWQVKSVERLPPAFCKKGLSIHYGA